MQTALLRSTFRLWKYSASTASCRSKGAFWGNPGDVNLSNMAISKMLHTAALAKENVCLSLSGCGFLGCYHIGVMKCFERHGQELLKRTSRYAGCSGGALVCAMIICCPGEIDVKFYIIYFMKWVTFSCEDWTGGKPFLFYKNFKPRKKRKKFFKKITSVRFCLGFDYFHWNNEKRLNLFWIINLTKFTAFF